MGSVFPDILDIKIIPPEHKREGPDWCAVFNPKIKRNLDVQLVHNFVHESVACCVRFSADGKYLATGYNRTAKIYDIQTGAEICVLNHGTATESSELYIRCVCFSPGGKWLATGGEDKRIKIWHIAKKRLLHVFHGHQQEVYSLDFSHDGRLIASGAGDGTVRIWDLTNVDAAPEVLVIYHKSSDTGITTVAISPNSQFVAAGSLDSIVHVWDMATGHLVEQLRGHRDSVYSVAFTPDGKRLISGSLDKTLKIWDVSGLTMGDEGHDAGGTTVEGTMRKDSPVQDEDRSSLCTMDLTGHRDYVLSVAVSRDARWIASASKDCGVQFWDARTGEVQFMVQGHKNSVISVHFSPAGELFATGSVDWKARIWRYSPL